jgi:hypothetical protein
VLDTIAAAGVRGMTTDEVEVATGLSHQTCSPRIVEAERAGQVAKLRDASGEVVKRLTTSKRRAAVYIVAKPEAEESR